MTAKKRLWRIHSIHRMLSGGYNNGVPTFKIYQQYPLPVNIVVHINKLEIQDKTDSLLSKNN